MKKPIGYWVTTIVSGCSGCGKTHPVTFLETDEPEVIDGEEYPYAGICSASGKRVYLRYELRGDVDEEE